jgi:hypothetical protein
VDSVGLHAGRLSKQGADVVRYGDIRRGQICHSGSPSHTRRSGTPQTLLDGLPLADRIDRGDLAFGQAQAALPPHERAHLWPYCWLPPWQQRLVTHGGVGYMANISLDSAVHNVRLKRVSIIGFLDSQVLVATRDILPHEEIISPYNNTDSECA